MLQGILEIFTSQQKAEAMLANPMIELIFMVLFVAFIVTLFVHLSLFTKLRKIRNYLKETNRMDIEPLKSFKEQFDNSENIEPAKVETFIQERFSSWRVYNVPVVSLIKLVQMTVSVFILIGVLGTFIGLTVSLGSIDSVGDGLVENIALVLSGIDMAFYTSIAGMGFSLIMTVLVKFLNTEYMLTDIMLMVECNLESNEQNGMNRLIEVSETINQSILMLKDTNQQSLQGLENAFAGFQEYTTGLQQSAKDLASFNDGLTTNLQDFQEIFNQMKTVTDGFGEGTTRLNNNFDGLFSYFKNTDKKNERMATAFENTYEKVQEVSKAQIETLGQFEESLDELKNFTSQILEEQGSMHAVFEKNSQKSNDLVEKMGSHNEEFKKVFGDDLSSKLGGIVNNLGGLSRDFDKLGGSIVQLPHALEVINQTQTEHKHLLSDRFQELKEFNITFSNHIKEHSVESRAFEKHVLEASKMYEQMSLKNNQLVTEINSVISQMNHTFNHRENQLETNVGILKDTLSKYVANLEGTLGDRLDKVARNIGNSMSGTSEGIKREFTEIRRISEDIQQNNFRALQQILQDLGREFQTLNRQLNALGQQTIRTNNIGLRQNEY